MSQIIASRSGLPLLWRGLQSAARPVASTRMVKAAVPEETAKERIAR
jgi:hypothetical protein